MITLKHDTLSFTFPEIARQVRVLVERRIQEIASELPPTWDRADLWTEIESDRNFHKLSPTALERAREKLHTWTSAHVEGYLREFTSNLGSLNTDSFAALTIKFQRTMRIPNDGKTYAVPTALGQVPLRSIDDSPETVPASFMKKGGVVMPLDQSEALWVWFSSRYRFAVKIGAGDINVLSGEPWDSELRRQPQNYIVAPGPPWGENDEVARRYVTMPLATGDSANGPRADAGRIQFQVVPMRAESYYRDEGAFFLPRSIAEFFSSMIFSPIISAQLAEQRRRHAPWDLEDPFEKSMEPALEIGARQEILEDEYEFAEWDQTQTVRCVVHPCDSSVWRHITGTNPPHPPLTAKDYEEAGIPWFDDYRDDGKPLPENSSIKPDLIVQSGNARRTVEIRECPNASSM